MWLRHVDLSKTPSGTFCRRVHPGSEMEMAGQNRRFQIDQKKANSAQISLLREICAIVTVFFLFIIIKIKKFRSKPE